MAVGLVDASTGPATFIAGELGAAGSGPRARSGFNGAGDVHRRRGWRRARRDGAASLASTGPATFIAGESNRRAARRCGHGASTGPATFIAGETSWSSVAEAPAGFNGAGDVHRRRDAGHPTQSAGNGRGFNGAGDVHRRRAIAAAPAHAASSPLQRGRRRSSPESRAAPHDHRRRAVAASTGPATFIAGELRPDAGSRSAADRASTGPATFIAGESELWKLDQLGASSRFNGAGDVHRRRGRLVSRRPARRCSRFNGAGDVHRRRDRQDGAPK